jgi:uncharacterized protein
VCPREHVKLNIHDIAEDPKEIVYDEATDSVNALLVHGDVRDFEFRDSATVRLDYYRAGEELFFHGRITGNVVGHCGRCLEEYRFPLAADFSSVLVPRHVHGTREADDEIDLGYYEGQEIDVSPLVQERIILALPMRPLCSDSCKGLCPQCGTNLNTETCGCTASGGDPRLAVLRNLKLAH